MDIFGPMNSIHANVAVKHPAQSTDAHLGVTAKMHRGDSVTFSGKKRDHLRPAGPSRPSATH
jgi:hypothetical protein